MLVMRKPKSIVITGRRWFQKTYGNTYNTVEIIIDGKNAVYLPQGYGYGSHYLDRATEWLEENGYLPGRSDNGPFRQPLWSYCEERGINLHYSGVDVARRKDL